MQHERLFSAADLLNLPAGRYCGLDKNLLLLTFYNGPAPLFQPEWISKLRRLAEIGEYTRPICLVGRMERGSICLVPRYETPNSRNADSEADAFAIELAAALETLRNDSETSKRSAPQIIVGNPAEAMRLTQILNRRLPTELLEGVTLNWHSCREPVSARLDEKVSVPLPQVHHAPQLVHHADMAELASA